MKRPPFVWTAWTLVLLAGTPLLDTIPARASDSTLNHGVSLPAGSLAHSLQELSRQLGIQILFDANQLKGINSSALSGSMTPQEALDRLLSGTALRAHAGAGESFLITLEASQSPTLASKDIEHMSPASDTPLEGIIVTGTHIAGGIPVGASLSTYNRRDFDEWGGATVDSVARYMMENFSGADSLATLNTNGNVGSLQQGAGSNIFGGAGFDLLGLGPGATLTLLDGHRIAPGGLDGSIVDVSLLPLSIIDHFEVLTDGASAIYGSDAIAGVVNVVTRRGLEGAETIGRYGRSTDGGAGEFTGAQLLGHAWSDGNVLFDYEYHDEQGLDASQRSWIGPEGGPYSLVPESHRQSVFLTATQSFDRTTFSSTALYSTREFVLDGIQLSTSGLIPNSETSAGHANLMLATITADRELPGSWHLGGSALYSRMDQWRNGEEFPDGLGGGHFDSALLADSAISEVDLSGSGQVVRLPAGAVQLALGGGFRLESFRGSIPSIDPLPTISQSRSNGNVFGELIAPIFGNDFIFPGMRRLEISFAYRIDRYNSFGTDSNAKWGGMWEPLSGVTLKATYGTSFRAPLISQLDAPMTSYTTLLPTAAPAGKPTDVLVVNGGSPYLLPEKSKAYTASVEWASERLPQVSGSVTYFNISYDDRIQSQNIQAAPLDAQPQLFSITGLNPGLAQVIPYFQGAGFQQDGAGLGPAGVTAIITNEVANEATTLEQGIRASGQYRYDTLTHGKFELDASSSFLLIDRSSLESYSPQIANVANTVAEPPKFRIRGDIKWQWRSLTIDAALNHASAYDNTLFTPPQRIGSWTTADAALELESPYAACSRLRGLSLVLNAQNLADRRPPFLAIPPGELAVGRAAVPFDGTNASALGRYVSLEFRKRW